MKDAFIYDGAGWQSLKGPPGPSTPSADNGNAITTGSDGLLFKKGEVAFNGSTPPELPTGQGSERPLDLLWVDGYTATVYVARGERPVIDPNLGLVIAAPEWHPIGVPSNDYGNAIRFGDDGRLYSPVQREGFFSVREDSPTAIANGFPGLPFGEAYWVRNGRLVTLTCQWSLTEEFCDVWDAARLLQLPFSVAEFVQGDGLSPTYAVFRSVILETYGDIVGMAVVDSSVTGDPTTMSLQPSSNNPFRQNPFKFDSGRPSWATFTVSYLTDDL